MKMAGISKHNSKDSEKKESLEREMKDHGKKRTEKDQCSFCNYMEAKRNNFKNQVILTWKFSLIW